MNIPKKITEVTNLKTINFARKHHFDKYKKRIRRYQICKELGFKPNIELGPKAHPNYININSKGEWGGTRTRDYYIQCNMTLCTEGECFSLYHKTHGFLR